MSNEPQKKTNTLRILGNAEKNKKIMTWPSNKIEKLKFMQNRKVKDPLVMKNTEKF